VNPYTVLIARWLLRVELLKLSAKDVGEVGIVCPLHLAESIGRISRVGANERAGLSTVFDESF